MKLQFILCVNLLIIYTDYYTTGMVVCLINSSIRYLPQLAWMMMRISLFGQLKL